MGVVGGEERRARRSSIVTLSELLSLLSSVFVSLDVFGVVIHVGVVSASFVV